MTALLLAAMAVGAIPLPQSSHAPLDTPGAVAVVGPRVDPTRASSVNCTDPYLSGLEVSPTRAQVPGLHTQLFSATTVGSCGDDLTNRTTFTWALSSSSLGALSATTGPSSTYTACLAQMSGFLRVTAAYDGVVLRENATISVSYSSAGGPGSLGGGQGNPAGTDNPTSLGGWAGGLAAVLLVAAGVLLALRTLRGGRRENARETPRASSQLPGSPPAESGEEGPRW